MKDSSGNILFIILIAVALFAALTYAIGKSSQGGGDNGDRETSLTQSSAIQQYPATIRGATVRMMVDNVTAETLQFNPPSDFGSLTENAKGVFHPDGGMVVFEQAFKAAMDQSDDNPTGKWVYTLDFEIAGIGTTVPGNLAGNDVVAFLVGLRKPVCDQINTRLGLPVSPLPTIGDATFSSDLITNFATHYMDSHYTLPATESILGAGVGDSGLYGAHEGCFYESAADDYVYYSVIVPR